MNCENALQEIGLRFNEDGELDYVNPHEDDKVRRAAYPIMRLHVTPAKFKQLLDQAMNRLVMQILDGLHGEFPDMTAKIVTRGFDRVERDVQEAIRREMTKQITSMLKERLATMPISLSVKGDVGP
jgi:hypothetical protein